MMFDVADDWEITCVGSGVEALEELAEEPYDVIVTDMRMPGMGGAEVLEAVHAAFPSVVRIVLSGYADAEMSLRTVAVAHQFLAKPCSAEVIRNTVARACELRRLLADDRLRALVGDIDSLPSVPRIYQQLTHVLARTEADASDVAEVVVQDPAMCAKLLQLVNSSFFARSRTLSDVRQAVMLLGMETVQNLALSCGAFSAAEFSHVSGLPSIESIQRHSLKTAAIAKKIAGGGAAGNDAFMAGVLHDVGLLVLAARMPDQLAASLALCERESIPRYEAERRVLGVTHAEVGAYLLGLWGLPYPVVEAVANHHEPARVLSGSHFGLVEMVYFANVIASDGEPDLSLAERCGVTSRVETWAHFASKLEAA